MNENKIPPVVPTCTSCHCDDGVTPEMRTAWAADGYVVRSADPAEVGIVVDARGMQPPEPFERTMDALEDVEPGKKVLLALRREPFPLYRALELNGCLWRTTCLDDGTYEILMWPKGA